MQDWVKLADASWQKFESIFDQLTRTPPILYVLPASPKAPRKVKSQIRRGSLQPKKLTFERDNSKKQKEATFVVWEDKDCNGPIARSRPVDNFAARTDEADKENRPGPINTKKKVKPSKIPDWGLRGLESDLRRLRI